MMASQLQEDDTVQTLAEFQSKSAFGHHHPTINKEMPSRKMSEFEETSKRLAPFDPEKIISQERRPFLAATGGSLAFRRETLEVSSL